MSISISQMKEQYISVDQSRYSTSVVDKYMDTAKVNTSKNIYKNTFPSDMIFTKSNVSTSDEQVDNLTREFKIHYRDFIGSLIYLLFTRVYFNFAVQKLASF